MSITLTPAQEAIATDTHRFRVVNCGRRFGKTVLAIDQIKACAAYRTSRIAYIAPTFQQARDIAWAQLKNDFANSGATINEARLEIRIRNIHGQESLIMLRGWESVETLRGQAFDLLVIDEVSSMRNFMEQWQQVLLPTLTDRRGEAMFISTPKGFNHFYDLFSREHEDPDFKSFHFTSYDNPNLPDGEIDSLRAQMTEDRFAQEYMADFRKTEGLVYKEFNRALHVFSELPDHGFIETIGSVDFGFTHPAAVPTIRKDYDGHYWVIDEWVYTGKTDEQIAEYVASCGFAKVYPDPENAAGIKTLKNHKINVREVNKSSGSVQRGINIVRELLKSNRLHVHHSCTHTILEFETYSYPPSKGALYDNENPLKENDDMMDALRYALMMDSGNGDLQTVKVHYANGKGYGGNPISKVITSKFPR